FEFIYGQEITQHEDIRLFGNLVSINRVSLGFENVIDSSYISIPGSVRVHIQFFKILITRELSDETVFMKGDEHMAGDGLPVFQVRVINRKGFHQLSAGIVGEHLENMPGALKSPNSHDIGIRIVVKSGRRAIRISGMKFIGSHDPVN